MTNADRLSRALTAALHSPEFALRFLSQAPAPERQEALRRWAAAPRGASPHGAPPTATDEPAPAERTTPCESRPGLRKCGAPRQAQSPATQSHDLALQLAAFARSIGRVS